MLHRLFTVASALSLLLCVTTLVLWARSYASEDGVWFSGSTLRWDLTSANGAARYSRTGPDDPFDLQFHYASGELLGDFDGLIEDNARRDGWHGFGFVICRAVWSKAGMLPATLVILPYWSLAVATSVLPLIWVRPIRTFQRSRRKRTNRCVTCGYSLVGNVSGICPECGKPVVRRVSVGVSGESS